MSSGLIQAVKDRFRDAVTSSHFYRGDATVILSPEFLLDVAPILDGIFGFLNHHGVPLHPQTDENGDGPIGVLRKWARQFYET